jgi:hypothetical protein
MRKATGIALLALMGLGMAVTSASGQINATATISSQQLSPTSYQYSLTLTNTGDTNISTFWFGWIPSYDLLPSAPTAFTAPAGWAGINAHDVIGTASAQWTTTTAPLAEGQSLSGFTFTSPDAPAALAGTFFGLQIEDSYVYIGAPEAPGDFGFFLMPTTVASTPEPSAFALFFGLPALLVLRNRR